MNCIDIWECKLNCEYKELTKRANIDFNKIPPDCPYRKSGQIGNGIAERLKEDIETERQAGNASTFEAYLQSEIKRFNDTKSGLVEIITNKKNSIKQTRWVEANLCFKDINTALTILYNELNKLQQQTYTQNTEEAKELVKPYFTATFKSINKEADLNYFDELFKDLEKSTTAKDKATILLLAYNSKEVIQTKKPSFAEWLSIWAEVLGCKKLKNYKPNKLNTETFENMCYYLHIKEK